MNFRDNQSKFLSETKCDCHVFDERASLEASVITPLAAKSVFKFRLCLCRLTLRFAWQNVGDRVCQLLPFSYINGIDEVTRHFIFGGSILLTASFQLQKESVVNIFLFVIL